MHFTLTACTQHLSGARAPHRTVRTRAVSLTSGGSSHRQFVLTGPGRTACTRTPHGTRAPPLQHDADSAGWTPSIPWTFLCLPWVPARWAPMQNPGVPSVGRPPPHLLTCCVKAGHAPSGLCLGLPDDQTEFWDQVGRTIKGEVRRAQKITMHVCWATE